MISLLIILPVEVLAVGMLYRTIKIEPRTIWLGFWTLAVALTSVLLANSLLFILAKELAWSWLTNGILIAGAAIAGLFLLFSLLFNLYGAYYSWQLWRKRYHTLANLLLPIFMVVFGLMQFYGPFFIKNGPLNLMSLGIIFLANYFFTLFLIFLVGAIVYDHLTRQLDSAYYVVLGAGLIGGHKVSKQLGNRIKLAVDAAKAYVVRHQRYPIIIFSGGKGGNDRPSEAQAMQAYAVEKFGYPVEFTMLEDQSTTTRENMRFSIQKIQAHSQGRVHHLVFFTSEYHVFRAVIQAHFLQIDAHGYGSYTPRHFRFNAFIREYVAMLNMYRRGHAVVIGVTLIVLIMNFIFSLFG